MAKEYIEREAALNEAQEVYHWCGYENRYSDFVPVDAIRAIPAADVVERKHGLWIAQDSSYTRFMCSECNSVNHHIRWDFCPLCGADMREWRTDDG